MSTPKRKKLKVFLSRPEASHRAGWRRAGGAPSRGLATSIPANRYCNRQPDVHNKENHHQMRSKNLGRSYCDCCDSRFAWRSAKLSSATFARTKRA